MRRSSLSTGIASLTLTVAMLAFAVPAAARESWRAITRPCPSARLVATPLHPGWWASPFCGGTVTPHVKIDGKLLLIADLSDRNTVVTFYGEGSLVRIGQRGSRITVLGETVVGSRVRVFVWFTRAPS